MTDERRKLIAEAMEDYEEGEYPADSREVICAAAELIEELTRTIGKAEDARDLAMAAVERRTKMRDEARATIAKQAKEIERLRAAIGCGHPNLRRTDITGTDVHGDGQ